MSVNASTANSRYGEVESDVNQIVSSFVEDTTQLAESLDAPEERVSDFRESAEALGQLVEQTAEEATEANQRAHEAQEDVDGLENETPSVEVSDESDPLATLSIEGLPVGPALSSKASMTDVENMIEDVDPTPEGEKTTGQEDDTTPIEQLSASEDVSDVTDSVSVERAVTLFRNLPKWGKKTPKGICLRPKDSPLQLLEAARDESLAWKQYYRAAKVLERLSKGGVTFFDSDRHGKMLVLHEQSEVYERITSESLSSSSVGETA